MQDKTFLDTNVLVYGFDSSNQEKYDIASRLILEAYQKGMGVISTQILKEFYVTVTQKIPQSLFENYLCSGRLRLTMAASAAKMGLHRSSITLTAPFSGFLALESLAQPRDETIFKQAHRQTCRLRSKTTYPVLVDAMRAYFKEQTPDLAWISQG